MTGQGGIVAKLIAAGTPPELIEEVALELMRGRAALETLERRRTVDRERKPAANPRIPRNSKEDAEIQGEPPAPSPEVSPQTPLPTPTHTPGEGSTRAREGNPFPRPEWADPQHWTDFLANRKAKRLRNSPTAYGFFLAQIAKWQDAEWPPGRLLEHAAARGWAGIYNPREDDNRGHPRQPVAQQSHNQRRPSPALELYKRGALREATEADSSEDGETDWGAGTSLPAFRTG